MGKSLWASMGGYLEGRGGRFKNNSRMQGLSLAGLRYAPLFTIVSSVKLDTGRCLQTLYTTAELIALSN